MSVNAGQEKAITSNAQQILVLAGAGTGKTRVIIKRIERLIELGVQPNKIVATTFTNKAAMELKHRLSLSIGPKAFEIICGTFHKISSIFLKMHADKVGIGNNFQILVEDDQKRLIKNILKTIDPERNPKVILEHIATFKETGKLGKDSATSVVISKIYQELFKKVFDLYEDELKKNNYLDYSDLICLTIFLFETHPEIANNSADHILIDEYQDINCAQYKWINLLSKDKTLFCVGDEDQAIYAFRGASIEYIQKFKNDYPAADIVQLEENYRSAKEILKGATNLIAKNSKQFPKNLIAAGDKEGFIRINKVFNEYEEAALIAKLAAEWKCKNQDYTIGILVRTNMQIHVIEHALVEAKIPYTIASGKKFYLKKEIQDIIAYFRVLLFPHDSIAFSRILNTPKRNMGQARLSLLLDAMKSLNCNFEQALATLLSQLPKNASEKCKILLMQIQTWRRLKSTLKMEELCEKILTDTQYRAQEEFTPAQEKTIEALKLQMQNFQTLEEFLENLQFEDMTDENRQLIIMTMHAAKGLEFDIVIAPGWEENIFPSMLAKDKAEIEEERRLAYVTITRTKQYLEIIHTCSRRINGQYKNQMPSRFLFDL